MARISFSDPCHPCLSVANSLEETLVTERLTYR
jgi:hypothetical protein